MRRRFLLSGLATAAAMPAILTACNKPAPPPKPVEEVAAPPPPPPPVKRVEDLAPYSGPPTPRVSLMTEKGEIVIQLEGKKAPYTVNNFLHYIDTGKLDGAMFWRASNQGGIGFIQGTATGVKFPPIPHELTTKTGLSHTNGVISMARFDVGTATNEFTISIGDQTYLDAGHDPKGDNQGYAAFGRVVKGMGVVKAILNGKIAKDTPAGGWNGQMLAKKVKILSAKRIDTEPQWQPEPKEPDASASASSAS